MIYLPKLYANLFRFKLLAREICALMKFTIMHMIADWSRRQISKLSNLP